MTRCRVTVNPVASRRQPDPYINSLGVRGIGEIGITGVPAAIANAVYHATGVRVRDLPVTLDKVMGVRQA
ncbi:hypothetical protein R69888_05162 [Paraburkholderia haematera]|uniref:Aldehyde oxidase/xanthine dehydrogenase second molybdopterin binding domain-containing protein n=1 Tax=Paraburkholderia haematera TaxID=2793077 RepID=A0ABN7MDR1_9BURK|nr:hypothetical protein R69888_05162 [Paraburkholderia haematera]